jgi:succinoglycan biosynthesis transport protein ExoP
VDGVGIARTDRLWAAYHGHLRENCSMQDDKRISTRLPVSSRSIREIDAYAPAGGTGETGDASAMNILGAVWRRRGVVLACIVLAIASGVVYLMRASPVYSASSTVLVQQATVQRRDDFTTNSQVSVSYLFTQCQLITSSTILQLALQEPGVADAKMLRNVENPVGYLKAVVTAAPAKQGDIMIVTMESPNPQDAADVVNGIVKAYIEYQDKQHVSNTQQMATVMDAELKAREKDLTDTQEKMTALRLAKPDLKLRSTQGGVVQGQMSQLTTALNEAKFNSEDLHSGLNDAAAADPNDLSTLRALVIRYKLGDRMPPSNLPMYASMMAQEQAELARLLDGGMGEASQQVIRARAAINRTQAEIADATGREAAACRQVLKDASAMEDARVAQLAKAIDDEKLRSVDLNKVEAEYDQYEQAESRYTREIELLGERLKNVQALIVENPITITPLESAKASTVPVRPLPSHILGLAGVGGLLLGIGVGLLVDRLDQRLRSVEEIANLLDATVLGVVPRIVRRVLPGEAGREIQLKPRSSVAEAFRTVRTAIYFGGVERAGRTILVTSPTPGDGKSTCISNLAIAVAQGGRRTLLIDADCRRPVQHKTFDLGDGPGLSSILVGKSTLDEAVRHTAIERLDVLPCGPLPHNPAELLDSQALLDLLGEAGRKYDQVLIDSPPVTLVSDARVLAASCDAAFLVVRHERSTRRGTTLAWNALASVGANLLGVVVNDLARQKDGYGYSYYGYGRYGYAPAKANGELPHNGNGNNGQSAAVVASGD